MLVFLSDSCISRLKTIKLCSLAHTRIARIKYRHLSIKAHGQLELYLKLSVNIATYNNGDVECKKKKITLRSIIKVNLFLSPVPGSWDRSSSTAPLGLSVDSGDYSGLTVQTVAVGLSSRNPGASVISSLNMYVGKSWSIYSSSPLSLLGTSLIVFLSQVIPGVPVMSRTE